MARVIAHEPVVFDGKFYKAGESYDDGKPEEAEATAADKSEGEKGDGAKGGKKPAMKAEG